MVLIRLLLFSSWLLKRPRFQLHFTPTSAAWFNLVERWFALLTEQQLRRGVFRSTRNLETTIRNYIDTHNEQPKPFIWTKTQYAAILPGEALSDLPRAVGQTIVDEHNFVVGEDRIEGVDRFLEKVAD